MPKKTCFVAMPFGDKTKDPARHELWTEIYEFLRQTVEATGLACLRADQVRRPGNVIRDIVAHLATADVVIADLTGSNPNVFYELGVRHALSNRTILLAQSSDEVPFDLRPYRHIVYRFTPQGAKRLAADLTLSIAQVMQEPPEPDSPVHEFLAGTSLRGATTSGVRDGAVARLEREIERLRTQNRDLAVSVGELAEVFSSAKGVASSSHGIDLSGTWSELEVPFHGATFIAHWNELVVLAYEGRWPGCCWGTVSDHLLRFAWSRFDRTAGGNGYYRIDEAQSGLEGGIWFDGRDADEMLAGDHWLERHRLAKQSISLDADARALLERARTFLRARGAL